jgi:hypothetical protein
MYYLVHTLHFDSVKFVEACVKLEKRRLFKQPSYDKKAFSKSTEDLIIRTRNLSFFKERLHVRTSEKKMNFFLTTWPG